MNGQCAAAVAPIVWHRRAFPWLKSPPRTQFPQAAQAVPFLSTRVVEADAPLMEAGIDSQGTFRLLEQMQCATGGEIPSTLTFDYPTARQLATFLQNNKTSAGPSTMLGSGSSDPLEIVLEMVRSSISFSIDMGAPLEGAADGTAGLTLSGTNIEQLQIQPQQ
jgi:hypothetical protein